MRNFEDLTEPEKALRSMIYAAETRHLHHVAHPMALGEAWLNYQLTEAKEIAEKHGIPLIEINLNNYH